MVKRKLTYLVAIVILSASVVLFLLYRGRYTIKTPEGKNFVEKIREENKAGFDSLQNALNFENNINYRIKESIASGDFKTAYALMDSLPAFGKSHSIHLYNGMIYVEQKKYNEAIEEFTKAINEIPYSKAESMRADVYIRINKLDLALADYMNIYKYNYFFSYDIANTFMLMHKKDSALKYYQIYLLHYPNDTAVQKRINNILTN
jgi:tetratricopeptide (TPR) repeat protein